VKVLKELETDWVF